MIRLPAQPTASELSGNPWQPEVTERAWRHIVIHHTASEHGSVESIHRTHQQRKDRHGNPWKGIGYHFVIGNGHGMEDGEIEPTFRWREQIAGAHAGSNEYNQYGIGIALVGNFEQEPPTEAQLEAIKRLVAVLKSEYGIAGENVIGHGEIKATACPGKFFPIAEVSQTSFGRYFSQRTAYHTPVRFTGHIGSRPQ